MAAVLLLAILALSVRIVVPQGYMVAQRGQGFSSPIVLCTADGARTVFVDNQGGATSGPAQDHSGDVHHDAPCIFAASAALASPDLFTVLEGVRTVHLEDAPVPVGQSPGRGLSAPPPPSTGPPILNL